MPSMLRWTAIFFICATSPGCLEAPPSADDARLITAISAGVWPDQGASARSRAQALDVAPRALVEALGPYRYQAKLTLSYFGEGQEETFLEETCTITAATDGRFHLVVDKTHRRVDDPEGTSGREAIFTGDRFYTRLRHGRWLSHGLLRKDHERWMLEAHQHLPVVMKLAAKNAVIKRKGQTLLLSRVQRWRKPSLPAGKRLEDVALTDRDDWFVWWGRTHKLNRLQGTISLNEGQVGEVSLSLVASVTKSRAPRLILSGPEDTGAPEPFAVADPSPIEDLPEPEKRRNVTYEFRAKLTMTVVPLPTEPVVAAPTESLDARRPRVQRMIDVLMKETP